MREVTENITKESYERFKSMTKADFYDEIKKDLPIDWVCGYGWYGAYLGQNNGEYYIVHELGDSCE